mmetsp:Transcript_60825/g.166694  ORF Transcript_60825/g.166694 Transcript_60825/m.166694 type:complete len:415 (-) Transcript_60825:519-1763(-)
MARRLARVWLRQLDDQLGLWPRDEEQPLVVVAPRDEVGASTGGFVHPARLDGEARPQVVEHAAHVDLVEVAAKVLVLHPEGAVVAVVREVQHLPQPRRPRRRLVAPLAVPLARAALLVERDAQPHQPVVLKLAARHDGVRAVELDPLLDRLRPRLALGVVRTADHVLRLQLLEHLAPQPVGLAPLGRDPLLLALLEVKLVADPTGKVLEPLRDRAALHPLVALHPLGVRLLDDHRPVDVRVLALAEGGPPRRVARDAVVDEHHLPVVVRRRVVAVKLAHKVALLDPLVRQLAEKGAVELVAVARDNVERRDEPLVVHHALDDAVRLEGVLEERGLHVRRGDLDKLLWPQPLRHDRHVGRRLAVPVDLRLEGALGAAGHRGEIGVLELAASQVAVLGDPVFGPLDGGVLRLLDVL